MCTGQENERGRGAEGERERDKSDLNRSDSALSERTERGESDHVRIKEGCWMDRGRGERWFEIVGQYFRAFICFSCFCVLLQLICVGVGRLTNPTISFSLVF